MTIEQRYKIFIRCTECLGPRGLYARWPPTETICFAWGGVGIQSAPSKCLAFLSRALRRPMAICVALPDAPVVPSSSDLVTRPDEGHHLCSVHQTLKRLTHVRSPSQFTEWTHENKYGVWCRIRQKLVVYCTIGRRYTANPTSKTLIISTIHTISWQTLKEIKQRL